MLERTAASIDTCSLKRILPSASRSSLRTCRHLQTTFWHHGATEHELFDACRSPVLQSVEPQVPPAPPKPSKLPDTMTASPFLLEFLYPSGAAAFLKRLRPAFTPEPTQSQRRIAARPFSSAFETKEDTALDKRGDEAQSVQSASEEGVREATGSSGDEQAQVEVSERHEVPLRDLEDTALAEETSRGVLERILNSGRGGSYELVWTEYAALDPSEQAEFTTKLIVHLGKSHRQVDSGRVVELFSGVDMAQWTRESVSAAIYAHLSLGDIPTALQIHRSAISETGITSGLDPLFTHGLATGDLDLVIKLLGDDMSDWQHLPQFPRLSRMPDFERKLSDLDEFLRGMEDEEAKRRLKLQVKSLIRIIARSSVSLFEPRAADLILGRAQDRVAYESYVLHCASKQLWDEASQAYRKFRKLPGPPADLALLNAAFDAFYPNNVRGLEEVTEDWYRAHGHMSASAYGRMASCYAKRGDIDSVARMTDEWAKWCPESIEQDPYTWVSSQMNVHAVRGNHLEAARIMDEAVKKWGSRPKPTLWNILVKAHVLGDDYEGAIETLLRLCDEVRPDALSFHNVLSMVARRGDLSLTLELYKFATEQGVEPNMAMMAAVVEAHCQNDRFHEAEELCKMTTKTRSIPGDYARLWNVLLYHHGARRDLTRVNGVLDTMTKYNIRYDDYTYSHLLTALVNCRQSHHAMHFLNLSIEQNVFKPNQNHYLILMAAFIESDEPQHAIKVKQKMDEMGFEATPKQVRKLIDALGRWSRMPSFKKKGDAGQHYLAWAMKEFSRVVHKNKPKTVSEMNEMTKLYSQMMFVLTQFRDFASIEQLMRLYQRQFPSRGNFESIPIKLLHNIMLADFYEKKYDRVEAVFDIIFTRSLQKGKPANTSVDDGEPPRVVPGVRYDLTDPLKTMQRLYLAQGNPRALMALVARVRSEGFELDSKNWNLHVQALATLKQWGEAFAICEEQLMPQWTGWQQVRRRTPGVKTELPLELRRLGSNPRRPRPISYTLVILAREYMELEQMALWSNEADRLFRTVTANCPRTVHAITTMVRTGLDEEEEIFNDKGRGDRGDTSPAETKAETQSQPDKGDQVGRKPVAKKLANIVQQQKPAPDEEGIAPGGLSSRHPSSSKSPSSHEEQREYVPSTMLRVPADWKEAMPEDFEIKTEPAPEPVVRKIQHAHRRRRQKEMKPTKAHRRETKRDLGEFEDEDPFAALREKAKPLNKAGKNDKVTEW